MIRYALGLVAMILALGATAVELSDSSALTLNRASSPSAKSASRVTPTVAARL